MIDAPATPVPTRVTATDYPTLQDAVDALPAAGGIVHIPAGTYTPRSRPTFIPPLVLPSGKPITLQGEGPRVTRLRYSWTEIPEGLTFDPDADLIQVRGDYQRIEELAVDGGFPGVAGASAGIHIMGTGDDSDHVVPLVGIQIRNCLIRGTQAWGLLIDDSPRDGATHPIIWCNYENLEIRDNRSLGAVCVGIGNGGGTTTQHFRNCYIRYFKGYGVVINGAWETSLVDCILEKEQPGSQPSPYVAYLYAAGGHYTRVEHCHFEGMFPESVPVIDATGEFDVFTIEDCVFGQNGTLEPNRDVFAIHVGARGRSVRIAGIGVVLPGPTVSDGGPSHIVIDPPEFPDVLDPTVRYIPEVLIERGCLRDNVGAGNRVDQHRHLRINECGFEMMAFTRRRLRLPYVDTDQRDDMIEVRGGDVVFNASVQRLQLFDGQTWRDLVVSE